MPSISVLDPPARVENPLFPMNRWMTWSGYRTPSFLLIAVRCQHPERGPENSFGSTKLCRPVPTLCMQGHGFTLRPACALQQVWSDYPFWCPVETVQHLQSGGDGHTEGQTDLGQHRHALRHAWLKGPNPDILHRSGWPGGADEHGHHRQAPYLVQATCPGQLHHHLDAWLRHWGTPCGVLVGFDSNSLCPWGMAQDMPIAPCNIRSEWALVRLETLQDLLEGQRVPHTAWRAAATTTAEHITAPPLMALVGNRCEHKSSEVIFLVYFHPKVNVCSVYVSLYCHIARNYHF